MPFRKKMMRPRRPKRVRRRTRTTTTTTTVRRIPRGIGTKGPFPAVYNTQLVYKYPGYTLSSGAVSGTVLQRFILNGPYDFDFDNNLGNKQPLYYDQLFGDNGPYKYYKVNAWKTTITVTNLSSQALHVYYDQGQIGSTVDADTQVEAQNRPGNIYRMVTGAANASPQCVITSFKKTKEFAPKGVSRGLDYGASYNAVPSSQIIGALLVGNLSVTDLTSFSVVITVKHIFYTTCYLRDAFQS